MSDHEVQCSHTCLPIYWPQMRRWVVGMGENDQDALYCSIQEALCSVFPRGLGICLTPLHVLLGGTLLLRWGKGERILLLEVDRAIGYLDERA